MSDELKAILAELRATRKEQRRTNDLLSEIVNIPYTGDREPEGGYTWGERLGIAIGMKVREELEPILTSTSEDITRAIDNQFDDQTDTMMSCIFGNIEDDNRYWLKEHEQWLYDCEKAKRDGIEQPPDPTLDAKGRPVMKRFCYTHQTREHHENTVVGSYTIPARALETLKNAMKEALAESKITEKIEEIAGAGGFTKIADNARVEVEKQMAATEEAEKAARSLRKAKRESAGTEPKVRRLG